MKRKIFVCLCIVSGLLVMGCPDLSKSSDENSDKAITAFGFASPPVAGTITEATHSIAVTVPFETNLTVLVPEITHTGTGISPASGVAQDFTGAVQYTVTAEDSSTQAYMITVTLTANPVPSDYISANVGTLKGVPAGTFSRDGVTGNDSTVSAFRMSAYEISRAQFLAIMGIDPSDAGYSSGTGDPVQNMTWYHAIAFCNKLSLAEGLTPVYTVAGVDFAVLTYAAIPTTDNATWNAVAAGWTNDGYRLPTEKEWEWAAMGATSDGRSGDIVGGVNTGGYTKGYAGSTEAGGAQMNIDNYAWYDPISGGTTHPVGTAGTTGHPNELGLYDISGNVREWCWDWADTYPAGAQTDYRGAASGTGRVLLGGSWESQSYYCSVAVRTQNPPYYYSREMGFRVVRP